MKTSLYLKIMFSKMLFRVIIAYDCNYLAIITTLLLLRELNLIQKLCVKTTLYKRSSFFGYCKTAKFEIIHSCFWLKSRNNHFASTPSHLSGPLLHSVTSSGSNFGGNDHRSDLEVPAPFYFRSQEAGASSSSSSGLAETVESSNFHPEMS